MKRWTLVAVGAALLLSACSGSSQQPSPASSAASGGQPSATGPSATGPSATGPSATGPSATGPSATGPSAILPSGAQASGAPCPSGQPSGQYRLQQFAGQGNSGLGLGKGGDVTVVFRNGNYDLSAKPGQPIAMTLANKAQADLYLNGTITGTYTASGSTRVFTIGSAKGGAYLTDASGQRTDLPFSQVASVVGLDGRLAAACAGNRLALAGPTTVFSFVRS